MRRSCSLLRLAVYAQATHEVWYDDMQVLAITFRGSTACPVRGPLSCGVLSQDQEARLFCLGTLMSWRNVGLSTVWNGTEGDVGINFTASPWREFKAVHGGEASASCTDQRLF